MLSWCCTNCSRSRQCPARISAQRSQDCKGSKSRPRLKESWQDSYSNLHQFLFLSPLSGSYMSTWLSGDYGHEAQRLHFLNKSLMLLKNLLFGIFLTVHLLHQTDGARHFNRRQMNLSAVPIQSPFLPVLSSSPIQTCPILSNICHLLPHFQHTCNTLYIHIRLTEKRNTAKKPFQWPALLRSHQHANFLYQMFESPMSNNAFLPV